MTRAGVRVEGEPFSDDARVRLCHSATRPPPLRLLVGSPDHWTIPPDIFSEIKSLLGQRLAVAVGSAQGATPADGDNRRATPQISLGIKPRRSSSATGELQPRYRYPSSSEGELSARPIIAHQSNSLRVVPNAQLLHRQSMRIGCKRSMQSGGARLLAPCDAAENAAVEIPGSKPRTPEAGPR
jgi:hypothetical protein